jgi:hypothetical protein
LTTRTTTNTLLRVGISSAPRPFSLSHNFPYEMTSNQASATLFTPALGSSAHRLQDRESLSAHNTNKQSSTTNQPNKSTTAMLPTRLHAGAFLMHKVQSPYKKKGAHSMKLPVNVTYLDAEQFITVEGDCCLNDQEDPPTNKHRHHRRVSPPSSTRSSRRCFHSNDNVDEPRREETLAEAQRHRSSSSSAASIDKSDCACHDDDEASRDRLPTDAYKYARRARARRARRKKPPVVDSDNDNNSGSNSDNDDGSGSDSDSDTDNNNDNDNDSDNDSHNNNDSGSVDDDCDSDSLSDDRSPPQCACMCPHADHAFRCRAGSCGGGRGGGGAGCAQSWCRSAACGACLPPHLQAHAHSHAHPHSPAMTSALFAARRARSAFHDGQSFGIRQGMRLAGNGSDNGGGGTIGERYRRFAEHRSVYEEKVRLVQRRRRDAVNEAYRQPSSRFHATGEQLYQEERTRARFFVDDDNGDADVSNISIDAERFAQVAGAEEELDSATRASDVFRGDDTSRLVQATLRARSKNMRRRLDEHTRSLASI